MPRRAPCYWGAGMSRRAGARWRPAGGFTMNRRIHAAALGLGLLALALLPRPAAALATCSLRCSDKLRNHWHGYTPSRSEAHHGRRWSCRMPTMRSSFLCGRAGAAPAGHVVSCPMTEDGHLTVDNYLIRHRCVLTRIGLAIGAIPEKHRRLPAKPPAWQGWLVRASPGRTRTARGKRRSGGLSRQGAPAGSAARLDRGGDRGWGDGEREQARIAGRRRLRRAELGLYFKRHAERL